MRVAPVQIVTNGDMSADITSDIQQLNQAFGYSVQANYTTSGTLGGTLSLEASVDHAQDLNGNVTNAGNWVVITNSPTVITGAGSFIWNFSGPMYPWVRLIYVAVNGDSGVLNAFLFERAF